MNSDKEKVAVDDENVALGSNIYSISELKKDDSPVARFILKKLFSRRYFVKFTPIVDGGELKLAMSLFDGRDVDKFNVYNITNEGVLAPKEVVYLGSAPRPFSVDTLKDWASEMALGKLHVIDGRDSFPAVLFDTTLNQIDFRVNLLGDCRYNHPSYTEYRKAVFLLYRLRGYNIPKQ